MSIITRAVVSAFMGELIGQPYGSALTLVDDVMMIPQRPSKTVVLVFGRHCSAIVQQSNGLQSSQATLYVQVTAR